MLPEVSSFIRITTWALSCAPTHSHEVSRFTRVSSNAGLGSQSRDVAYTQPRGFASLLFPSCDRVRAYAVEDPVRRDKHRVAANPQMPTDLGILEVIAIGLRTGLSERD